MRILAAVLYSFAIIGSTCVAPASAVSPYRVSQVNLVPEVLSKFLFVGSTFNPDKLRQCEKFAPSEFWKKVMGISATGPSGPCYSLDEETLDASGSLLRHGTIYGLKELEYGSLGLVIRNGQVVTLTHSNLAWHVLSYDSPKFKDGNDRSVAQVLAAKARLEESLGAGRETNKGMHILWWYDPSSKIRYSFATTSGYVSATAELIE